MRSMFRRPTRLGVVAGNERWRHFNQGLPFLLAPTLLRQAMPRYKDRTDPKQIEKIERTFPHIIEISVPLGGFGKKLDDMYEWHWARDIEAMRGRGWRDENGRFYVRWCFANVITAQDFVHKFGGSYFLRPDRRHQSLKAECDPTYPELDRK